MSIKGNLIKFRLWLYGVERDIRRLNIVNRFSGNRRPISHRSTRHLLEKLQLMSILLNSEEEFHKTVDYLNATPATSASVYLGNFRVTTPFIIIDFELPKRLDPVSCHNVMLKAFESFYSDRDRVASLIHRDEILDCIRRQERVSGLTVK